MAGWRENWGVESDPAAPEGLQQRATAARETQDDPAIPSWQKNWQAAAMPGQPAWTTGGQRDSTKNGFDTPFYKKMAEQIDASAKNGTYGSVIDRKDYTGIVTYDQTGSRRSVKFGDVYEDGQLVSNMYDPNSGYTRESANWIMGQVSLDGPTFAKMDSPEKLDAEIRRVAQMSARNAVKGAGAKKFDDRVDATAEDWSDDNEVGTMVGLIGAGAGGGALTGAGIGSLILPGVGTAVGAVAGTIVGGLAAWLNRDELVETAARAVVQTEMAEEKHGGTAAFATALYQAGTLGMKALSPLNNLTHGIYDVATDGFNDEAGWYAVDPVTGESTRPWGVDVLGYASMIPDGLGMFGAKAGQMAFKVAMQGVVGGATGQMVATGGETFDQRRGGFDNVFLDDDGNVDVLSGAAGVATIGIDAIQLGGWSGLIRASKDSARLFGTAAGETGVAAAPAKTLADKLLRREARDRVETGGFSYQLDDEGRAIAGSRRASLGLMAPSEMFQGATASMMTRIAAKNTATGRPSADDYYQMAVSFGNGQRRWGATLTNAIGEGYEEAIQAGLEPVSHNEKINWAEVGASALGGAAMGAGMGGAVALQGASQDQRLKAQAQTLRRMNGQPPITDKEWKARTPVQKRAESAATAAIFAAAATAEQNLVAEQTISMAAQFPAVEARHGAAALAAESRDLANAAPKTDLAFRITQTDDATVPGVSVSASLYRVAEMLRAHTEGLGISAATETDPLLQEQYLAAQAQGQQLLIGFDGQRGATGTTVGWLEQYDRAQDNFSRHTVIDEVNTIIGEWFLADTTVNADEPVRMARAKATSFVLSRDPIGSVGSFQVLMPLVNRQLSRYHSDHVLEIGHAVLQPLGADFDGDKIRQQARLVMDEARFMAARAGTSYVTANGKVNILTRHYEEWEITLFKEAYLQGPGSPFYSAAQAMTAKLERRLTDRFGPIPGFDALLQNFIGELQGGDTDARANFLDALALQMSPEIFALDPGGLTNQWVFVDEVVQQELQAFQQMMAGRIHSHALNVTTAAPLAQTSEAYVTRQAKAVSDGQTLAQRAGGSVMFRMFQLLRYSVYRSTVLHNDQTGNNVGLVQLTEFFNMLGEGMVESKLDALRSTSDISARVQYKIRALSENTGIPIGLLVNVTVPNVDSRGTYHGKPNGDGNTVSLLQSLLREELRIERGKYAAVLESDPDMQARFAKIENLTKASGKKGSRVGAAVYEVYQETSLYEMIGDDAITLGVDLTFGQYARRYIDMDYSSRKNTHQRLAMAPEYLGRKDTTNIPYGKEEVDKKEVSPFRSIVDSLLDYGNHHIYMTLSGELAGTPGGTLANQSDRTGSSLRQIIEDLQAALRTYTNREIRDLTPDGILQLMRENEFWADAVMELIPASAGAAFFRVAGELQIAPWLVTAFTLPPAKAELSILVHTILMTYNARGGASGGHHGREYADLTDRFHRILYRLANANDGGIMQARFVTLMDTADDVPMFIRETNKNFLGNEAPVTAWVRDTAEFDADRPGGGWSTVLDGAAERAAIQNLKEKTIRLVDTLRTERNSEVADAEVWAGLKRARTAQRAGTLVEGSPDAVLLYRLDEAIAAAPYYASILGPAAMEMQGIAIQLSMYDHATAKGEVPRPFGPEGRNDAMRDFFGTNYEITKGSLTARDLDTIIAAPGVATLPGGFSTTDVDGVPVEFPGIARDYVIDNWGNAQARSFIQSALWPSVQESVADGQGLTPQYLVEPSLSALLLGHTHTMLFEPGNEDLYASYVEARATGHGSRHSLQSIVHDLLLNQTAAFKRPGTIAQFRDNYQQTLRDVVRILQALGDLGSVRVNGVDENGQPALVPLTETDENGVDMPVLESLRRLVKKKMRAGYLKGRFSLGEDRLGAGLREELDVQLALTRTHAAELELAGDPDAVAEATRLTEVAAAIMTEDPVTLAIASFGYDGTKERRKVLQTLVQMAPNLVNKTVWAADPLVKLLNGSGAMMLDPDGVPMLEPDEWHKVGRAVIAEYLERVSAIPASDELPTSEFPDYRKADQQEQLKYWDPSGAALVDDLFNHNSGLVAAAIDMHQEAHRAHQYSRVRVAELVDSSILRPDRFGPWTMDLPRVQVEADERPRSSGSEPGISMSGLAPPRTVAQSAATRLSTLHPTDDLLSVSTATADALLNGHEMNTHIPVLLPNQTTTHMPLAQLNGRFVSELTVTLPGNPTPVVVPVGQVWPFDGTAPHPTLRMVTWNTLQAALKQAIPAGTDETKVQVSITMAHPDAQPFHPDWMHNVYFEGLAHRVAAAANAPSLTSALWVVADGISPVAQEEALSANKTGTFALMLATVFSRLQQRVMQANWERKLSGTLLRKTRALMSAQNGQKPLSPIFFNAVYKELKGGHFVRGVNKVTGEAELWSAEKVIDWQNQNPGKSIQEELDHADLWVPSAAVLRRLYGDTRSEAELQALTEPMPVDYASFDVFPGIVPKAQLAQIKGALTIDPATGTWLTRDILDTRAASRRPRAVRQRHPALSDAQAAKLNQGRIVESEKISSIYNARFEAQRDVDFIKISERAFNFGLAARTRGRMTLAWITAGYPFIPRATNAENELERALMNEEALALDVSGHRVAWIFRENDTSGRGPVGGIQTGTSLANPPSLAFTGAPNDLMFVDTDAFEGDMGVAKMRLEQMVAAGLVVLLVSSKNRRNEVGTMARYLQEAGYRPAAGSQAMFLPPAGPVYQNDRARESSLVMEEGFSAESSVLILEFPGLHVDENAIIPIEANQDISGEVALVVDLMPLLPFQDFAPPRHPKTVLKVQAQVRSMATPENLPFLLKQAGVSKKGKAQDDFVAALEKLIDRWDTHPEKPGILPSDEWGPGDLIPIVRSDSRGTGVLLYRHGFDEPTRDELEAQLERAAAADGASANVAVYKPTQKKGATVHTGRIESVDERSKFGMQAKLWVPLKKFGNKIQIHGMKYVIGTGSLQVPKARFFTNWGIDYAVDIGSSNGKNAWLGRLKSHRMGFAVFGIDLQNELVEFFTGVTPDQGAAFTTATTRTLDLLQLLGEELPKQSLRALNYAARNNGALASDLLAVIRTFAAEQSGTQFDWLDQLDRPQTPADRQQALNGIASATLLGLMAPMETAWNAPAYARLIRSGGFNAPGARNSGRKSQKMMPLVTEFYDRLPMTHPTRVLLNEKMNDQINNDPNTQEGFHLNLDFTISMTVQDAAGNTSTKTGWLKVGEVQGSGDNPELDAQAQDRSDRQPVSTSTQSLAHLVFDGRVSYDRDLTRSNAYFNRDGVIKFEDGKRLWALLQDVPPTPPTRKRHLPTPADALYMEIAGDVNDDFMQALDLQHWKKGRSKEEYQRHLTEFNDLVRDAAHVYGLTLEQKGMIHAWIRLQLGKPKDREEKADTTQSGDKVSFEAAISALADIIYNGQNGWLPTVDAEVPQITHGHLAAIYRANQDSHHFVLRTSLDVDEPAVEWSDWVQVALAFGETKKTVFDGLYLTAVDGAMHTYMNMENDLMGLPVSRDDLRRAKLYDPETQALVLSIDNIRAQTMSEPVVLNRAYADFGNLFGTVRLGSRWAGKLPPGSALAKRRAARKRWRKDNKIAMPVVTNMRNFRQYGQQWVEESTSTHAVVRMATDLRAGMAMLNPLLWIGAGYELGVRSALEDFTNLIRGDSTAVAGRAAAAFGGSYYSSAQQTLVHNAVKTLGTRTEFKGMVYGALMYVREHGGNGFLEKGTRNFAKWGGFMQDPTWGLRGDVMARHYLDGLLQYVAANPTESVISVEKLISNLTNNPAWAMDNLPRGHEAALATIADLRSLKDTPASLFIKGIYEPLTRNPNLAVNMFGNFALRIPLLFSGYAANVLQSITGFQGGTAMLATTLNGRVNPMAGIQSMLAGDGYKAGAGQDYDMSTVLEGLDISKAFVKGAVTHTSLFTLGLLAGEIGLGGGDAEDRRLKKAMLYQGGAIVYDPRDIVNDFRNADAIYLDWLPFGLDKLFTIPDPDGVNSSQSMAKPHWLLNQFVSPILGMERFFESGDLRHIIWGFQGAIGSMPLINAMTWSDATLTFARLADSAPTPEQGEELEQVLDAYGVMIRMVATYERMLFESSFVNMLYVQADKYDRDQWSLPEKDADGNILRDRLDVPRPSKALEDFIDPDTGEVRMSSRDNDWWTATLHSFTENRGTLALAFSLFTGQGLQGETLRQNMVAKTRSIDKTGLDQGEAESLLMGLYATSGGAERMTADTDQSLILSMFDAEGREMLNERGARAVIEGVWKQSVQLGSPALDGIFIPKTMRQTIQKEMMADLIEEGMVMGLNEYDAKGRMYDIWYGPSDDPAVQGLGDLLWSDKLSYTKAERYYQLNTTYVIGPDGKPWATGVARSNLHNMFGFAPVNRYYAGDVGLGVDNKLNALDVAQNVNTGLRALDKVDESWLIPTPEEVAEEIKDAITEAMGKTYSGNTSTGDGKSGWIDYPNRSYGYRSGGSGYSGGGSGGSGYAYRVNSPVRGDTTYGRNIPFTNGDNPIIRRATIRRERYSSTRGRLNQWQ